MFLSASELATTNPDVDPAQADQMIEEAEAMAVLAAPCITKPEFDQATAVRGILRAAIVRWLEAGSGAYQSQQAGPFGVTFDNRQPRHSMFSPSEINQLRSLCKGVRQGRAFAVDLTP